MTRLLDGLPKHRDEELALMTDRLWKGCRETRPPEQDAHLWVEVHDMQGAPIRWVDAALYTAIQEEDLRQRGIRRLE